MSLIGSSVEYLTDIALYLRNNGKEKKKRNHPRLSIHLA